MPDVVIHAPESTSPSTPGHSTRNIPPVQETPAAPGDSSLVFSSVGSDDPAESVSNPDTPPNATSSSLPQLSVSSKHAPPVGRGTGRRRGNLSLGCLVGRVPRVWGWKRSPNNDSHDGGRDNNRWWWYRWNYSSKTADDLRSRTAGRDVGDQTTTTTETEEMARGVKRPGCSSGGPHDDDDAGAAAAEFETNAGDDDHVLRHDLRRTRGQGHASRTTTARRKRVLEVGVAWSRSQELQPRKSHHDVLGFSKLATRRRSSHCVYSESVGPEHNAPYFL